MPRESEMETCRDVYFKIRMTRKERVDLKILSRDLKKPCSKIVREAIKEYKEKVQSCS
jgi:predicted DNA-binding protein